MVFIYFFNVLTKLGYCITMTKPLEGRCTNCTQPSPNDNNNNNNPIN